MRRRTFAAALVGLSILCLLGWILFAYAPGDWRELRRSLVAGRSLPWPSERAVGTIVHASAWDSELDSVELTVRDASGRRRVVIVNDSTSGSVGGYMPGLVGERIAAEVRGIVPWSAPEYFALSVWAKRQSQSRFPANKHFDPTPGGPVR